MVSSASPFWIPSRTQWRRCPSRIINPTLCIAPLAALSCIRTSSQGESSSIIFATPLSWPMILLIRTLSTFSWSLHDLILFPLWRGIIPPRVSEVKRGSDICFHVIETRTAGDRSLPGDPVREKQRPAVLRRADHPPAEQYAQKLLLRGFRALTAPTLTLAGALARTGTTTGHVDLLDLFG